MAVPTPIVVPAAAATATAEPTGRTGRSNSIQHQQVLEADVRQTEQRLAEYESQQRAELSQLQNKPPITPTAAAAPAAAAPAVAVPAPVAVASPASASNSSQAAAAGLTSPSTAELHDIIRQQQAQIARLEQRLALLEQKVGV